MERVLDENAARMTTESGMRQLKTPVRSDIGSAAQIIDLIRSIVGVTVPIQSVIRELNKRKEGLKGLAKGGSYLARKSPIIYSEMVNEDGTYDNNFKQLLLQEREMQGANYE